MGVGWRVSIGEEISVIYSTIKDKRDKEMTDTFINDIVILNRHLGEM